MPLPDTPSTPGSPSTTVETVFTVGDTLAPLRGRITSDDGTGPQPVDGTDTTAEVHIARPAGPGGEARPVIIGPVTVDSEGAWSRAWADGDLDVPGVWWVEVQVTFPSGGRQTFRAASFTVEDQIA